MLARLQFWLQGHPSKARPWPAVWFGNRLSDARFSAWRLTGARPPTPPPIEIREGPQPLR